MLAKGPHRSTVFPHRVGVIGWITTCIYQRFVRHFNALHHRNAHLSGSNGCSRHIQYNVISIIPRNGATKWVSDEASITATVCHHHRIVSHHINVVHRHHASFTTTLSKNPNATQMGSITQSNYTNTMVFRAFYSHVNGLHTYHSAETCTSIK